MTMDPNTIRPAFCWTLRRQRDHLAVGSTSSRLAWFQIKEMWIRTWSINHGDWHDSDAARKCAISLLSTSTAAQALPGSDYPTIVLRALFIGYPEKCGPPPTRMEPVFVFDPNPTIGALQIGVLASYVLFGVTTTQTYIYYNRFPDDYLKLKTLVSFVWLCELAHAICIAHTLYTYTISNYGHPERLIQRAPESLEAGIFFSGVVTASVQAFFSFRIYALSHKLYIPLITWTLSFLRFVLSTVVFTSGLGMIDMASYEARWGWLAITLWSVSAANDLLIAATLVFILAHRRSNVHQRTAALVEKLIGWTIETGVMTSAFGLITLVCFLTMSDNFIWLGMITVSARLFSNSLLASLNSRASLRALDDTHLTPVINLTPIHFNGDLEGTKSTQAV
ncbi:hypothetical protein B0H19DRAFT_1089389 [Mycena capillaripes]|nr:hypothetical protein B0H19DRAFT_1089389 [Mycena capillaripes]